MKALSVGSRFIVCTVQIRQKELLDVCKEFSKYNHRLKAAVSYLYFCISSSNRFNNVSGSSRENRQREPRQQGP